jgi:2-polyprenyl-3-methyl-5-hydroxy-6-metoxy-1,4-benzoquinol methylase
MSTGVLQETSAGQVKSLSEISLIHRDEFDQSLNSDPYKYAAKTGRDELERKFIEYADSLPSDSIGMIDPSILVQRACPLCGSSGHSVLFVKYRFPICKCGECGFVFANPILDQNTVHAGYMEMGEMSKHHLTMLTQDFYKACAWKRFEFELQQVLLRATRPMTSYLEIGCSVGTGLEVAQSYGLEAFGIEPNADAAAIALERGHNVIVDLFKPGIFNGRRFDVVACMDVLEHLADPVGFLGHIRSALTDDGLALIQVPNAGALISILEGEKNQIFNGLIHYNYFDCASLDRAAEKAGLVSVGTISVLSELGKLKSYSHKQISDSLSRERPELSSHPVLHQDWINANCLGYKVIGIYKAR